MISIRVHALNQNCVQKIGQCFLSFKSASQCNVSDYGFIKRFLHSQRQAMRQQLKERSRTKQVTRQSIDEKPFTELTLGQKVTRTSKDASYLSVILVGVTVTGAMFYYIGRELFSKQSASGVYGVALKDCKHDTRIQAALGSPIKGYAEANRRGRRRFTSNQEYEVEGVKHIRMKFYVEGPHNKGTAHLEKVKDANGKYQYRYLFVDLDNSNRSIIIIDNRQLLDAMK